MLLETKADVLATIKAEKVRQDAADAGLRARARGRVSRSARAIGAAGASAWDASRKQAELQLGRDPGRAGLPAWQERFVNQQVALIQGVTEEMLGRVQATVTRGIGEGLTVDALAARLDRDFRFGRARAHFIAQDQILKAAGELTRVHQTRAGVQEYTWIASNDERVRGRPDGLYADSDEDHWSLNGKRFRWDSPPVVNPKTGQRAHPGQSYVCRCTASPVIPDDIFDAPDPDR